MSRLIDADEFMKRLTLDISKGFCGEFTDGSDVAYTSREISKFVNDMPTIDAVEVVRCRDCEHYWDGTWCVINEAYFEEDDFCSYGERKENRG